MKAKIETGKGKIGGAIFYLLFSLFAVAPLGATTVSGTIKRPDGTPINGTIEFTLSQSAKTTTPPVTFAPVKTTCVVTAGAIAAGCTVQGNDTLDPAGTFYRVRVLDLNNLAVVPSANYTISGTTVDLGSLPVTATDTLVPPTGSVTGNLNVTGNLTVGGAATFGGDPQSFSHIRLLGLTADPAAAASGSIFQRSDLNRIRFRTGGLEIFDGSQFLPVSASSFGTIEFGANLSLPGNFSAVFKRLNQLRLVDPFLWLESGVPAKINAAIADCGGLPCRVILPSNLTAGWPARSTWPETVAILDLRGNQLDPFVNGAYYSPFKFTDRKTEAADSALDLFATIRAIQFHDSGADNATGGPKDTYFTFAGDLYSAGKGQDISVRAATFKFGEGDAVGVGATAQHWGNCLEGGGECGVGFTVRSLQGNSVPTGIVSTYTAGTRAIAVSSGSELDKLGVGRAIINTTAAKTYSTGSVTSINSAAPPIVTGSGTSWVTQFGSGAHSDLCFSQNDDDASGLKFVVPIRSIDSQTSLTLDYFVQAADKPWPGDNNGSSYRIYKCAKVESHSFESVGATTASLVHVSGGTTDWAASDTLELPLGWSWYGGAGNFIVQNYLPSFSPFGLVITNTGSDEALTRGIQLGGKMALGLVFDNTWECPANGVNCTPAGFTTGIRFQNAPTVGLHYASSTGTHVLSRLNDQVSTTGNFDIQYDASADRYDIQHAASLSNGFNFFVAGSSAGTAIGTAWQARNNLHINSNSGFLRLGTGTNPATGFIRQTSGNGGTPLVTTRNQANSADVNLVTYSSSDRLQLSQSGAPVEFLAGVHSDGAGFKHRRVSTGSISASSSAAVTVSWTTAFADSNYTASCSVVEATAGTSSLRIHHLESVSASSVIVRVVNDDSGAAKSGTLHCTAMHD